MRKKKCMKRRITSRNLFPVGLLVQKQTRGSSKRLLLKNEDGI